MIHVGSGTVVEGDLTMEPIPAPLLPLWRIFCAPEIPLGVWHVIIPKPIPIQRPLFKRLRPLRNKWTRGVVMLVKPMWTNDDVRLRAFWIRTVISCNFYDYSQYVASGACPYPAGATQYPTVTTREQCEATFDQFVALGQSVNITMNGETYMTGIGHGVLIGVRGNCATISLEGRNAVILQVDVRSLVVRDDLCDFDVPHRWRRPWSKTASFLTCRSSTAQISQV